MEDLNNNIQDNIERYLHNLMNEQERAQFNKALEKDPILKENVILQQNIHNAFNDESVNVSNAIYSSQAFQNIQQKLRTEKYQHISSNIKQTALNYASSKEQKPARKLNPRWVFSVAAMILIFLVVRPLFNSSNYYDDYANWDDLPSLIEKGDAQNKFSKIEQLYSEKKYNEIVSIYGNDSKTIHPYSFIYIGAAYVKLEDAENAKKTFDLLINTKSIESSRGYWYKAMLFLKQNNIEKTKEMLMLTTSNEQYYNYKKALQLLKELQ